MGKSKPGGAAAAVALALIAVLGVTLALRVVFPRMAATQHFAGGLNVAVNMPWIFDEVSDGNHLEVKLPLTVLAPRVWNITPDDHLTDLRVNGQRVPLDGVRPGGLSDWQRGFEIDLSPWLQRGVNSFEFTVDNYDGIGGLALRPHPGWRVLLLAAGFLPWLLALARLFRLRRAQTLILSAALLVLCFYWAATPWTLHNYDVKHLGDTGHLGYVNYVATLLALPRSDLGWEYYQPPLYYVGGAVVWRWAQWLSLAGPEALQAFAIALWLVFLAASAATLRLALGGQYRVMVATAALALWPSGIIHAVRIGNDPPLYAAAAVATLFMFRWWRSGRRAHLLWMALSIAVALLVKTSASALMATAGTLMALRLLRHGRWHNPRFLIEAGAASAIMAAGVLLSIGRNIYYWWRGEISSWLIGAIDTLDADLRVPNQFRYFLPLDVPVFLASPWVDSRDDATGRTNFWNFLLRSSLSGEFHFEGGLQGFIAFVWGALLLWLLSLLVLRAAAQPWSARTAWRNAPWIVVSVFWLASVLSLRIAYPFSCTGDFRYILPILVPLLIAFIRTGRLAQTLLVAMALSSAVFFVAL